MMSHRVLAWLTSAVVLLAAIVTSTPAQALVITPHYDDSWLNDGASGWNGNMAAATLVVENVIAEYEAAFSNAVTITIAFGLGETEGSAVTSGASANITGTNYNQNYTLAQVKALYAAAAAAPGATAVLKTANANLPATYPHPGGRALPGGAPAFIVPDSEYIALTGAPQNADAIDGFTGYAVNFCGGGTCPYDFTGGAPAANAIDFTAVVEHEVAHAMGKIDFAFADAIGPQPLTPEDFFKYDCGTANLDPNFNATCFSFDGDATNPGGRTWSNSSDSGDWIGFPTDSFNAFLGQGKFPSVSTADIQVLCAEGWNDARVCGAAGAGGGAVPEPGTLALLGSSLFGLAVLRPVLRRRRKWLP